MSIFTDRHIHVKSELLTDLFNISFILNDLNYCGYGQIRTNNVYPVGRDLQSLTTPPSSLHIH